MIRRMGKRVYLFFFLFLPFAGIFFTSCVKNILLVTGSFTQTGEEGMKVFEFNSSEGTLKLKYPFNAGPNPSYFCLSERYNLIYAINEIDTFLGKPSGSITTIKYTNSLEGCEKVNEIAVPTGGPCYISVSPENDFLFVANYGGGSAAVVKLDENGIPVAVTDTIIYDEIDGKRSHAHMIDFDPAGKRIYVSDLGLDRIMIYEIDKAAGRLLQVSGDGIKLPAGTGPRHFVFNPEGIMLYVMGELNSTVSVFRIDGDNTPLLLQSVSSLRGGGEVKNYSADIQISQSGEFLYASNRGENTIAVFRILSDGKIELAGLSECGGNWPRNFTLDPSGEFLLAGNQKSDNIAVFRIDKKTGIPTENTQNLAISAPSCLKFR
jgi:6-phosphogluconolactonase